MRLSRMPPSGFASGSRSALALRERIGDWISPPRGPESGPVELTQRRVYILPTGTGVLFAGTLVLMLIGSINYNLSLGYGLTFLLAGTGVVTMLHTWRNLAHVQLRPGKSMPVFAGDRARFVVFVSDPGRLTRIGLAVQFAGQQAAFFDLPAAGETAVRIRLPVTRRGVYRPGRFRIFTTYPLGLFYAWANVELDLFCLVYPAPEAGVVPLPEERAGAGQGVVSTRGEEDFAGLRPYHIGDSTRRIAWKAVARSGIFVTKQFAGSAGADLWLDLADTPASLGLEARLSRLARWVIDADACGARYGLRLAGKEIDLGAGEGHRAHCLGALALFQSSERE